MESLKPEIKPEKEKPLFDLKETLEIAKHLLNDYSEKIPDSLVSGEEGRKLVKIQTTWFQGVVAVLESTREHIEYRGKIVPTEITNLSSYLSSDKFEKIERNTREDINQANKALELSLDLLSKFKEKEE